MQRSPLHASLVLIILAFMAASGFACGSNTPLPTYTPAATYTPLAPLPTHTPAATYTPLAPLPTYTPAATYTPLAPLPTHTPAATYTPLAPLPTYTPAATYTPLAPLPTHTPAATYTPLAPLPTYTPAATHTPLPTYTPVPAATHTPSPSPTPTPSVGMREKPVPLGTSMRLGNGWEMTVVAVNPDASTEVLAENQFNDPPQDGSQFYMVTVRAKYLGEGSDRFNVSLKAVGQSAVVHTDSCGVLPNDLAFTPEVFTGGGISGNVCWEIASTDAESLEMFFDPWISGERIWFALAPDA